MPRARYTAEGGTYRVAGISFEPGDEREVDHELADYLSDHKDFVVSVEKAASDVESDSADDDDDEDETDSDGDGEGQGGGDGFDVGAFLDRTPVDDVVEDIKAGEADDHLSAVAEAANRVTIEDAIGQRRAELEG